MIDYSQVIKAWREYRRELKWVENNYPNLKDKCLDFISWVKRNVSDRKRKIQ